MNQTEISEFRRKLIRAFQHDTKVHSAFLRFNWLPKSKFFNEPLLAFKKIRDFIEFISLQML